MVQVRRQRIAFNHRKLAYRSELDSFICGLQNDRTYKLINQSSDVGTLLLQRKGVGHLQHDQLPKEVIVCFRAKGAKQMQQDRNVHLGVETGVQCAEHQVASILHGLDQKRSSVETERLAKQIRQVSFASRHVDSR